MLLKPIKNETGYKFNIFSMSEYWTEILITGLDYIDTIPPQLINREIVDTLNEVMNNNDFDKEFCFHFRDYEIGVVVKYDFDLDLLKINKNKVAKKINVGKEMKDNIQIKMNAENNSRVNVPFINHPYTPFDQYNWEINELVKKVFVEDNSINARLMKLENSILEIKEDLKNIEDNFLVTRFDGLKAFRRGDWKILITGVGILILFIGHALTLEKVEYIFEKFEPLDLNNIEHNEEN